MADGHPVYVRAPIWSIRALAQLTEWTMVVPLVAKAQAQMLAEGVSEPSPYAPWLPVELRPRLPFDEERIRVAVPEGRFALDDLRVVRWLNGLKGRIRPNRPARS